MPGTDEQLISKKELLEKYNISYGALYRWKRKGLIPDEWFIKQSTTTGQETFFPKELVCERIEHILNKKEEVLLDEIADELNRREKEITYLILNTAFGEKSFRFSDINSIKYSVNGYGNDITEEIKSIVEKIDKKARV